MHRRVKLKTYLTLLATNMKKATCTSLKLNVNFYNIMKFRICIKKKKEKEPAGNTLKTEEDISNTLGNEEF